LEPVLAPVLEVAPVPTRLPAPTQLQAIVITSSNALAALPEAYHAVDLLAVGDATAARARAAGFATVYSAGKDADALALLVAGRCNPGGAPLLLASGEGQGNELAVRLQSVGFTVLHHTVYAARQLADLPDAAHDCLASNTVRAVLFFSPATASAFIDLLRQKLRPDVVADVDALAISHAVATALALLPWRRVRVASHPNQEELLALLDE
jgi:uroporphyrinogen-III synthase